MPQNQVWILSYSALTMWNNSYGLVSGSGTTPPCNCVKLDDMVMNRILAEKNVPVETSGSGFVPGTYKYSTSGAGSGYPLSGAFTDYFDQRLIMNAGEHKLKMDFSVAKSYYSSPWPPITQYDTYFIHNYVFEKYSLI